VVGDDEGTDARGGTGRGAGSDTRRDDPRDDGRDDPRDDRRDDGIVAASAAALLLLAGCAGQGAGAPGRGADGDAPEPTPARVSAFQPGDPLLAGAPTTEVSDAIGLVGEWQLVEADGDAPGTVVWINGTGPQGQTIMVFRECGPLWVEWAGTANGLVTGGVAGDQACFLGPDGDQPMAVPEISWLAGTRSFRAMGDGDGVELLGADGEPLAQLEPAMNAPAAAADWYPPDYRPTADEESKQALRVPTPLADGLIPASRDDLLGTWTPVGVAEGSDPTNPHTISATPPPGFEDLPADWPDRATITYRADGRFTIDECRMVEPSPESPAATGLPWIGDGTGFFVPSYAADLLYCWPSWPGWDTRTRTIALDNGYLRLFDIDGDELGRLERVG
jgi:hypothetical protein